MVGIFGYLFLIPGTATSSIVMSYLLVSFKQDNDGNTTAGVTRIIHYCQKSKQTGPSPILPISYFCPSKKGYSSSSPLLLFGRDNKNRHTHTFLLFCSAGCMPHFFQSCYLCCVVLCCHCADKKSNLLLLLLQLLLLVQLLPLYPSLSVREQDMVLSGQLTCRLHHTVWSHFTTNTRSLEQFCSFGSFNHV